MAQWIMFGEGKNKKDGFIFPFIILLRKKSYLDIVLILVVFLRFEMFTFKLKFDPECHLHSSKMCENTQVYILKCAYKIHFSFAILCVKRNITQMFGFFLTFTNKEARSYLFQNVAAKCLSTCGTKQGFVVGFEKAAQC